MNKKTFLIALSTLATAIAGCGGGGSGGTTEEPVSAPLNAPPVAIAGANQNVRTGIQVALDGTASTDANGDSLTYSWTMSSKPPGSTAVIEKSTSSSPTFTPDLAADYVLSLRVSDGKMESPPSIITISATSTNSAPVASPVALELTTAGTSVALIGDSSNDADGDALTYLWALTAKPSGSGTTLLATTTKRSNIVVDLPGTYAVTLIVNDGKVSSEPKTIVVSAGDPCCLLEREFNDSGTNPNFYSLGLINTGALSTVGDIDWYHIVTNYYSGIVQVDFDVSQSTHGIWRVTIKDKNNTIYSIRNISPPGDKYTIPVDANIDILSVIVEPYSGVFYNGDRYSVRLFVEP